AIDACRRHPLARALRIDKLSLAALEATLRIYRDPARALREVPVLRMLVAGDEELAGRAELMRSQLQAGRGQGPALPAPAPGGAPSWTARCGPPGRARGRSTSWWRGCATARHQWSGARGVVVSYWIRARSTTPAPRRRRTL